MMEDTMNPYVGLRPFETDEDLLFFGRDKQTLELLQRLHNHPFLAVVGGSGSGKSSLIRAGLIPALKGGYLVEDSSKWKIAVMKPGQNPMFNFAEAILRQIDPAVNHKQINDFLGQIKKEGTTAIIERLSLLKEARRFNFFLLVDQFEELFRYQMDTTSKNGQTEAIDFVNTLLNLTDQKSFPFYIVLTMRSDFIGDCAQFHGLPEALNKSQYLVPRLNREEMKRVIEGPSKLYGKKFSPALTSKLLNDTTKVRDELPLLQHALMRIWDYEVKTDKSGALDLNDYKKIGGIKKALAIHADEALDDMNKREIELSKVIFKALTAIDENGRKIRRPVLMSELKDLTGADEQEILDILDHFIRDRRSFVYLQNVSDSEDKVIDISHESLIRQWNTLSKWVDEEDEAASTYKKLAEDLRLYHLKKKDLLAGSELQLAMDWYETFQPTAAWANRYEEGYEECMNYLAGSHSARNDQLKIENIRSRRLRNTKRAVMGLLVLIILSGIIITTITSHNSKTRDLHNEAKLLVATDPTTALWLAVEAMNRSEKGMFNFFYKESEKDNVKKTAQSIYNDNSFYKRSIAFSPTAAAVTISPDGRTFLIGEEDGTVRLRDRKGGVITEFKGHPAAITSIVLAPNGNSILTGSEDGTVHLWDLKGAMIIKFNAHNEDVSAMAFAPDGNSIITGSGEDGTVRLWDMNGALTTEFKGHKRSIRTMAFAPDGNSILTGSEDGTARLWDLEGTMITEFIGHYISVYSVAYAPDGNSILTGSYDETARLWDLKGTMITEFKGHQDAVGAVAFAPDGNSILTGSFDRTARLWDLKGTMISEFKGHEDYIITMAFTKDGNSIITGSEDYTVRLWDLKDATTEIKAHKYPVFSATVASDGNSILTGSDDGTARLWDMKGAMITEYSGHQSIVTFAAFAPDENTILTGSWDETARLWDMNGTMITEFVGHSDYVTSGAFAPDGNTILTGSDDETARLWDLQGSMLAEFIGHDDYVTSVAFAPDGNTILTGSEDGTARLWDLQGSMLTEFRGHDDYVTSVAFAPDGNTILTGSEDRTARLWNLQGTMITEFKGHNDYVTSVAFAPDGNSILTGSGDRSARLWDLQGDIITKYKGREGDINSVTFTPDGNSILTGSIYGTVRLWKIPMSLREFLDSGQIEVLKKDQKKEYGID